MAAKIKQRMMKDREKLIEMYHRQGLSLTDIAGKYGCSRQYVQLIFISLGIERRERIEALGISPNRRKSRFNFGILEDNFIKNNFRKMTDREIARYLNKPAAVVTYRRLVILGKKKIERRNFTREEDQFILKNYKRLTDQAIANELDRSLISVTHHRSCILNRPKRKNIGNSSPKNRLNILDFEAVTDQQTLPAKGYSGAQSLVNDDDILPTKRLSNSDSSGDSADRSQM